MDTDACGSRRRTALLVLALIGCVNRSREETILRAFTDQSSDQIFDRDAQPQYLLFSDELTASVLKNLIRSGRYRIPPKDSSLLCRGVPVAGMHGYLLSTRVGTVMGDSAIAMLIQECIRDPRKCPNGEQLCFGYSGVIQMETTYLLLRRNGKWRVEKPLSGSTGILM